VEAQHGNIGGLMVVSWKEIYAHIFHVKREGKLEKERI